MAPMTRKPRFLRSPLLPPLVVGLWGWVLMWSTLSGRLDLLLNAAFHPVVGIGGVVLVVVDVMQLRWGIKQG